MNASIDSLDAIVGLWICIFFVLLFFAIPAVLIWWNFFAVYRDKPPRTWSWPWEWFGGRHD